MNAPIPERLEDIACDADFTIRGDGSWTYAGTPIRRESLVKLFSTILRRDEAGEYWLQTPVEKCRIQVEDRPFLAVDFRVEAEGRPEQRIVFTTNIGAEVALDGAHALEVDAKGPYVVMEKGLSARINRPAYYRLVEFASAQAGASAEKIEIRSAGEYFLLGDL